MSVRPRPLIAGNWKMNGLVRPGLAEIDRLAARLRARPRLTCEIVICPPATLIAPIRGRLRESGIGRRVRIGAQDCHAAADGPHTGDLGAEMLADAGCSYVIVGHSERRADHGETDALVRAKAEAVHRAGLAAIVCVGETLDQREAGQALRVVGRQLAGSVPEDAGAGNTVIAYEPVWAIGTGRTPTPADVARVHAGIRRWLGRRLDDGDRVRVLYGGSVKAGNAADLLTVANVDGALVGGASLKAADFWPIVESRADQ